MSALDHIYRFFSRQPGPDVVARLAQRLPAADAAPDRGRLRLLYESPSPSNVCDWMDMALWQDVRTGELWLHSSGGIGDIDLWQGPGAATLLDEPGGDRSPTNAGN